MDHATHNKIVSFIWSIADDCLRDVFVRGKCGFIFPSGSGGVARASLIHRLQDFIPPG